MQMDPSTNIQDTHTSEKMTLCNFSQILKPSSIICCTWSRLPLLGFFFLLAQILCDCNLPPPLSCHFPLGGGGGTWPMNNTKSIGNHRRERKILAPLGGQELPKSAFMPTFRVPPSMFDCQALPQAPLWR